MRSRPCAAQKINEAEVHIAAIDRELANIDAVLPHARGPDRRQVWDVRSLLMQDRRTLLLHGLEAESGAAAFSISPQYARAREASRANVAT
jgi:hypothetical protein